MLKSLETLKKCSKNEYHSAHSWSNRMPFGTQVSQWVYHKYANFGLKILQRCYEIDGFVKTACPKVWKHLFRTEIYFKNNIISMEKLCKTTTELIFSRISSRFDHSFDAARHGTNQLGTDTRLQLLPLGLEFCKQIILIFMFSAPTRRPSSSHRCSMGLRSGDWLGHGRTSTFLDSSHWVTHWDLCFGSLSIWYTHLRRYFLL